MEAAPKAPSAEGAVSRRLTENNALFSHHPAIYRKSNLIKEINFLYFTFSLKLYRKSIFFFHRKKSFSLIPCFFHIYLLYDR